jgi:hypothetical protein
LGFTTGRFNETLPQHGKWYFFADVTQEVGLDRSVAAMGANFGDLDNDGFLDFYLGTGAPTYTALMPNLFIVIRMGDLSSR